MKAVIKATEEYGSLKVADMPKPKPQERQALIRIKATAICNTDASIINNKYVGRKPVPIPLILGHEGAGIVEELGEGVEGLEVGDHVALEPIYGCGHCEHCKKGYPNMCQAWNHTGITEHGTFAEYVTVPANNAHKISDKLDFAVAACTEPLGLVTRTLEQTKPMLGETVAIIGPGSLGLMHLLAFKAAGAAKIYMVGLDKDKVRFETAHTLGANGIVNISEHDAEEKIMEFTDGHGADIVVETANSHKAAEMAFHLAAAHGRVSLFGLYPQASFSPLEVTRKALQIFGDVGQVTQQFLRSISWLETGMVDLSELVKYRFGLEEAEDAFDAARRGDVVKVIFEP